MTSPGLARARALAEIQRWDAALTALAATPEDELGQAAAVRAQCLLGLRRPREALAAASTAVEADPDDVWAHLLVAASALRLGRSRDAREAARAAAALDVAAPGVLPMLARTELACGDRAAADRVATDGVAQHPEDSDAHEVLARVALERGQHARAEEHVRTALALDPHDADLLALLADVLARAGRPREAREAQVAAVRTDPLAPRHQDALTAPVVAGSVAGTAICGFFAFSGLRRLVPVLDQVPSPVVVLCLWGFLLLVWLSIVRDRRRDGRALPPGFYAGLRRHRRRSDLRWLAAAGVLTIAVGVVAVCRWIWYDGSAAVAAGELLVGAALFALARRRLRHYRDLSEPSDLRVADMARLLLDLARRWVLPRRS